MNQFRTSDKAEDDLRDIWLFVARNDPDAADRLVAEITRRFPTLAQFPEIGRRRDELLPDARSLSVGRYLIFYRLIDDGIEIIRVVHGARNLPALFDD